MGHRSVPHTADIRIEAWAPTREECIAEAVAAAVESFADTTGSTPTATVEVLIDPGTDEDMLLDVLSEVIYQIETTGQVPLGTHVEALPSGLRVRFEMTDADRVEPVGAAPKAVSLHDLRFTQDGDQWRCSVILDV
ncbi:MAG: archease [Micromonosporaceae bacterium]